MSDFEYEFQMASMNRNLNAEMDTVFMMTSKDYFFVSSRTIKEVASFGGSVAGCVPEVVEKALREEIQRSMKRCSFLLAFAARSLFAFSRPRSRRLSAEVYEIRVHGVIGPPVSPFITDSLKDAGSAGAQALLILLDTPGGLDTSMREIVKAIMECARARHRLRLPLRGQGRIGGHDHPYCGPRGRHGARERTWARPIR